MLIKNNLKVPFKKDFGNRYYPTNPLHGCDTIWKNYLI